MIELAQPAYAVPVELPRWYACVRRGRAPDGPFAVFDSFLGSEIAKFETAGQSGAVLFDGYLFDQPELARELGVPDASPAEIVVAAYRRWGRDVFDRVDGCYLIAIWDGAAGRLLVGHDALGRHPVYYANEPQGLWFSSNILSLTRSGRVARDLNPISLAMGLLAYWPDAGETSFSRVRRLRPGHYLEWRDGALSEHRYWDPMPDDDEPWMSDEEAHEGFEPALMESVARCMTLDPQGIMLSGGVDSTTVAALASKWWRSHGKPPIVAISGQTGYTLSTEEATQAKVATALGMRHLVSTTNEWREGRDGISLSLDAVNDLPSPSRVYWVGTYMKFFQRAAKQQLRVLLTGAGGDTWLGVADTHAADLLRGLKLAQLARFLKSDMSTGGASISNSARRLLWQAGVRHHIDTLWARVAPASKASYHRRRWEASLPDWLCPDSALRAEFVERLLARRTPPLTETGQVPRSYYRHSLRSLANPYMHYENEVGFHVERLCGLCLLSPYHDRRLVSFFNRISPRALVHEDRYKGLLRALATKHLPDFGLERQRKDGEREEHHRLQDLRKGIAQAWPAHDFTALASQGVVDAPRVAREIEGWEEKTIGELGRLHILMSSERWIRAHAGVSA